MLHQSVGEYIQVGVSDINTRGSFSSLHTFLDASHHVMAGFNFMADVCWIGVRGTNQ